MARKTSKTDGRPAFQLYVKDYLSDSNLAACSLAAQGLWMRILCLMYQSPERGCLVFLDGRDAVRPISAARLGPLVGVPEAEVSRLLEELIREGAAGYDHDRGVVFNRRMRRNAEKEKQTSASRSASGKKGGRPRKARPNTTPDRSPERVLDGVQTLIEKRATELATAAELGGAFDALKKQSEPTGEQEENKAQANVKQMPSIQLLPKPFGAQGL